MGIPDFVTIEYPLPVEGLPKEGWQTKTIDSTGMISFIITEDGRLLEKVCTVEIVDGEARETERSKWMDRNYEGIFTIHNVIVQNKESRPLWYEFEIAMIDGRVRQIRLVKEEEMRTIAELNEG